MKRFSRCIAVILGCLLPLVPVLERRACANMPIGTTSQVGREVVACYFGALRKDGKIMVNLVPGAAGKVYPVSPTISVTLNGISVGQKYLVNGMPITLFLNSQKSVDLIQVRPAGDR